MVPPGKEDGGIRYNERIALICLYRLSKIFRAIKVEWRRGDGRTFWRRCSLEVVVDGYRYRFIGLWSPSSMLMFEFNELQKIIRLKIEITWRGSSANLQTYLATRVIFRKNIFQFFFRVRVNVY